MQRALGDHLTVVTGLPRPDRWVEVRAGRRGAPPRGRARPRSRRRRHRLQPRGRPGRRPGRPARPQPADPRRARRRRRGRGGRAPPTRSGSPGWPAGWSTSASAAAGRRCGSWSTGCGRRLGWSERDIVGMVEGFARLAGVHFLPDDRAAGRPGAGGRRTAGRVGRLRPGPGSRPSRRRWCRPAAHRRRRAVASRRRR